MKLEELEAMSTKDLLALHNKHAEKQIKRASSRDALIKRTASLLEDAAPAPKASAKAAAKSAPKASAGKGAATGARGRPAKDFTDVKYVVAAKRPVNRRLSGESARAKVFNFIEDRNGALHTELEKKFTDVSIIGVVKYLQHAGFIEIAK